MHNYIIHDQDLWLRLILSSFHGLGPCLSIRCKATGWTCWLASIIDPSPKMSVTWRISSQRGRTHLERDIVVWKILNFLLAWWFSSHNSRTRFFPDEYFCRNQVNHCFHIHKKERDMNGSDFCWIPQKLICMSSLPVQTFYDKSDSFTKIRINCVGFSERRKVRDS